MNQPMMRKRGIYGVIVAILVVGVTTFASLLYIDRMQFGNRLQGRYQKELYDLIGNVQNLESDLSKVTVTISKQQSTLLFGDIWRQAGAAADRVNSLPITHVAISQTSKFLSQVSDFSYSLVRIQSGGEKLSDQESKTVELLQNNAAYLGRQLFALQRKMEEGNIKWSEIKYEGSKIMGKVQTNLIDSKFAGIDKQMQDHPTLIYDGPFSENVLNIKPRVTAEAQINMDAAKKKVSEFIGADKIQEIGSYSSKADGNIPAYPFYVILKNKDKNSPVNIDISKNGGHIIFMLDNRVIGQQTIDVKRAIDIGLKFLIDKGYKDMIPSFSQRMNGVAVINYIYTQSSGTSNIVIYPDQIKLKIALDNGEIIGFEAEKYLTAHSTRNIPKPKISVAQARLKANPLMQVTNSRLVIIPLLSTKEVFCYEFAGKKGDNTFVVYINAENGNEENLLQIINTPEGQLAM